MPSGRVHSAATLSILLTTGICATGFVSTNLDYICLSSGMVLGFILNSDLDVNVGNISYSYIRQIPVIGWLLKAIWWLVWRPYALIIPHRSILSHYPILSTVIRILYILSIVSLTLMPFGLSLDFGMLDIRQGTILFVGLAIIDISHWLLDRAGE